MDDAAAVSLGERLQDLARDGDYPIVGDGAFALEQVGQILTAEQLHHDVERVAMSPVVMDRDRVGVVEPRGELRLTLEPLHDVRDRHELRREHLDRDLAIHVELVRTEDDPEPATADRLDQLVAPGQDVPRLWCVLVHGEQCLECKHV